MPIKKKIAKSILTREGSRLIDNLIEKAQDNYKQKWFNPKIKADSLKQIANELKKQGYKDADIEDLKERYDTTSRVAIYMYPDEGGTIRLIKDAQPFKVNNYHFFIKKDSTVLGMYGYLIAKGNNTEEAKKLAMQYVNNHKSDKRKDSIQRHPA